jgi:deoxyribodipyrimidine photo-lyase
MRSQQTSKRGAIPSPLAVSDRVMGRFNPTRAAALERLAAFAPRMGRPYADQRNHDYGLVADHSLPANVSALSPWIRHRLISEREVIEAALPSGEGAAKFVSEVLWRSYFKGWLEQRPTIWSRYCTDRDAALALLERNGGLARDYAAAVEGRTGIDAFDAWAQQLVEANWLHNHARMWFASIWIFTLRLPWQLGADFFLRHLLDGDAASNTLSWRWVAGLHTPGKHYLARADNIRRYTGGRFVPQGLDERAGPLPMDEPPQRVPLPLSAAQPVCDYTLLITGDNCDFRDLDLERPPATVVGLVGADGRAPDVSAAVTAFANGAVGDAVARAAAQFGCTGSLVTALPQNNGDPIVAPWVATGWCRDALAGQGVTGMRNAYDDALWPLASAGFFKLRTGAASVLRPLGLMLPAL